MMVMNNVKMKMMAMTMRKDNNGNKMTLQRLWQ